MNNLAILGGEPTFAQRVTITEPTLPPADILIPKIQEIIENKMITNSKYVKEFEAKAQEYIQAKHIIATSCCTSGLMLFMKSLNLKGEVILPSFTFSATGHAVLWNNLSPVFVDVDPETYNLDPAKVEAAITPNTCAILGVHLFGNPADVEALEAIAKKHGLKLFFDAAHGFGATHNGRSIGNFGDGESFSMSPTKLLTGGEGGVVATNNDELAYLIRIGRSYADPGTYDTQYAGLSARMGEFNAILALESLAMLDENVAKRQIIANSYYLTLSEVPGISFQVIREGNTSSFKDFSILIDPAKFGLNRDELCIVLDKENIVTKKYFFPALHKQKSFADYFTQYDSKLPITNQLADNSLSLPLYSHMPIDTARKIGELIVKVQVRARDIKPKLDA